MALDRLERKEIARLLEKLFPFPEDMGPHLPPFGGMIFPKINQVFPKLTAADIVSVQPMSLPTATVFYSDFVRNEKHYQQV